MATRGTSPGRLAAVLRAVCVLSVAAGMIQATRGAELEWRSDYASARREAAAKGRPLLLNFGTQNCFWCKKLDESTFRDPDVITLLNKQFVALKIDAERDTELTQSLRIQGYPTILVASPDGKILDVMEGFRAAGPFKDTLERALASAANPDGMTRDYQEATRAIAASDYARAVVLLKNVMQDGNERPVQVKARQLLQEIEQQSAGRLNRAKQLAEQGQTTQAIETATELIRVFPGTESAIAGATLLTSLTSPPDAKENQRTRRARDLLGQAREDFRSQQFLWCLNRCDALASTCPDLPEAEQARQLAAQIKDNPEWLKQACDDLSDQLGVIYLTMAETWLRKGQPQQAILCLERVIQTLPGTRQAAAAQIRLAQIQGQPAMRTVEFKRP